MKNAAKISIAVLGVTALAACATAEPEEFQTISIPYDPYDFDPADLQAEADAHCSAYNMRAVYEDETIDSSSVRWRYRHFRCF